MMRFIHSSLAIAALMATDIHCFTISPVASKIATRSALRMSSYDEQLKAFYDTQNVDVVGPPVNGETVAVNGSTEINDEAASIAAAAAAAAATAAVNRSVNPTPPVHPSQQTLPPPAPPVVAVSAPPPVPASLVTTTASPPQEQVIVVKNEETDETNPLAVAGVLFLGLPLWLILSTQVFFNPTSVQTTPQVTTTNQIVLPDSIAKSGASPSGIVVLSQPITKAEVRKLFDLWNDALKTGDPATVAKRYGRDGVLLPTLSDVPRTDFDGIKDYFVGFLKKKPVGKILEGEIFIGNNWAQDAGKTHILVVYMVFKLSD